MAVSPTIASNTYASLVTAWFVFDSGSSGPGTIHGKYRASGDTDWSAPFTFEDTSSVALAVAEGGFGHVSQALDGTDRWIGTWVIAGETTPSDWFSEDDCRTWQRF